MNSLIKAILMHAAYQGASAVCGGIGQHDGKPLPLDPQVQDAGLQQKGVLVYELAKIQYHALHRALHDQSGVWPDPQVSLIDLPALLSQGIDLLGKLPKEGTLGTILELIGRIGSR
jgi:hypothetical protein